MNKVCKYVFFVFNIINNNQYIISIYNIIVSNNNLFCSFKFENCELMYYNV